MLWENTINNGDSMTEKEKERRQSAKRGNASEKYKLGWDYHHGLDDVSKNLEEAVKWYHQAAKQGHVDAQANLGWMYENGDGVQKNNVNACIWYKRAMDQGQEKARANYNRLIQNMPPKDRDRIEAKAEGQMAYVKQLIKSFLKWVIRAVILLILCVFAVFWFPEDRLPRAILDVKKDTLDKVNKHKWWGSQEGPPQIKLEREDFTWLSGPLYGNETDTLSVRIKNYGGYARDMTIELSSNVQGLSFPHSTTIRNIPKDGVEAVNIPISGKINLLPTIDALLDFRLNEPNHDLKYAKQLFFETREFRNPQLILTGPAFEETVKALSNNQINKNDQIELKFYVQNVGCSAAKEVKVSVGNKQRDKVVKLLGRGDDYSKASKEPLIFSAIDVGEYKLITYHYLVTGEFKGYELKFEISATESFNKYGFDKELVTVALNEELDPLIPPTEHQCSEDPYQGLRVEDSGQEPQVIAERENDMQPGLWEPSIQQPDIDLDPPPPIESNLKFLKLSDAKISSDDITLPNPTYPFKMIKLEFSVKNEYRWPIKEVEVQVENYQGGIVLVGSRLGKREFSTIDEEGHKPITYEYSINEEEFNDREYKFAIHVTYQYQSFDNNINDSTEKPKWESMEQKWVINRQVESDNNKADIIPFP